MGIERAEDHFGLRDAVDRRQMPSMWTRPWALVTGASSGIGRAFAHTVAALGRKTTVRPGGLSRTLGWSLAMLLRPLRVRVIGQVMKGMADPEGLR